jgi:hypothetical protein
MALTFIMALLVSASASAQVVTELHLGTIPPNVQCGERWVENNIELYFTDTTADDCDLGGNCFFGLDVDSVWLFPARLMVDFGGSYLVFRVEIDIIDYCGPGCTQAFLYNGGAQVGYAANTTSSMPQTLVMDLGAGGPVDSIAISSCEGQVIGSTITIYSATVATDSDSWSAIKALYK